MEKRKKRVSHHRTHKYKYKYKKRERRRRKKKRQTDIEEIIKTNSHSTHWLQLSLIREQVTETLCC